MEHLSEQSRRVCGQLVWENGRLVIECPSPEERDRVTHYLEEQEVLVRVRKEGETRAGEGASDPRWPWSARAVGTDTRETPANDPQNWSQP